MKADELKVVYLIGCRFIVDKEENELVDVKKGKWLEILFKTNDEA